MDENETEATMDENENEMDENETEGYHGPFGKNWELEIEMDLIALRAVNGEGDEGDL